MPPDSVMTLASFLSQSERSLRVFSTKSGSLRLPNTPRLNDTVFHTETNASTVSSCGTRPIIERVLR